MANLRIFDNPKGKWFRAGQFPPLGLSGTFPNYVSSASYEGRISITNPQGDCAVQLLSSTNLPPGAELRVDNDTSEVVLTWPIYAVLSEADTSIQNGNFELGAQDWLLGAGWDIGTWNWEYDGDDNDLQAYDGTKSAEYHAGFRGNSRIRSAHPRACTPATSVTASCQVQQGPSAANHTGGWVTLQFLDASLVELELHEGNHVNSSNDAEWHLSTVTAIAPAGTAYAVIGGEGYRRLESKPMWLDTFAWNLPAGAGVWVGTNDDLVVTISLRVTDAAGRKVDGDYTIIAQPSVAAGLLADIAHYWSFDGDLTDEVGGATMDVYGDHASYQAGKKSQEAKITGAQIALLPDGPSGDCSFWGWFNVVGSASGNRLYCGLTTQVVGSGGYRKYVQVTSSGGSITGYLNDNLTVGAASGLVTPDARYFFRYNYNATTLKAELFINEVSCGLTPAAAQEIGTSYFGMHSSAPGDAGGTTDYLDECGLIVSRQTTLAEGAYLYAAGAGKSFADIVADA